MPKEIDDTTCSLGSPYIIGFVKLRELLDETLKDKGGLNFTQFRLLLKSAEKEADACLLSDLASMLHLQPNVVSQAANVLEMGGLIRRVTADSDGRAKRIEVTERGRGEIERLNVELKDRLYSSFNPSRDPLYDAVLESSIYAAADIETSLSPAFIARHQASAALITFSTIVQRIVEALKSEVDASFNECRMLQRLAEVGQPMRAVDLSLQLMLPATTITRAATRLEKRGWLVRLASSVNQQAVFLFPTQEGTRWQNTILETLDRTGNDVLWSRLDSQQVDAIKRVGEILLEEMRAQDSYRRYAVIGDLIPIEH